MYKDKEKGNILTIGDSMITMNPQKKGPLRNVTHFERNIGGAELNFAIGCSRLGLQTKFISRVGQDDFGRFIYNFLRGEGIDTNDVTFVEGHPTSLNFKEIQEDGEGETYYYRTNAPISTMNESAINEEMLEGIDVVHLTGVFLSLYKNNLRVVKKIIQIARKKRIMISFDPNIRLKMWTKEEAKETFDQILPDIDILLAGAEEAQDMFGSSSDEKLEEVAQQYNISSLVIKDGANGSKMYRNNKWVYEKAYEVEAIDSVGAGDGFNAGFIYAYLRGFECNELLNFANCVGAMVTTVVGDNEGLPYLNEVLAKYNNERIISR